MNVLPPTLSGWFAHDEGLRARLHAAARNVFVNAAWRRGVRASPSVHVGDTLGTGLCGSWLRILTGRVAGAISRVPHGGRLGTGAAARIAHAAAEPAHRLGRVPAGGRRSAGRAGPSLPGAADPRRRIALRRRAPHGRRLSHRRAPEHARRRHTNAATDGVRCPTCRFVTRPTTCLIFPICLRGSMAGSASRMPALHAGRQCRARRRARPVAASGRAGRRRPSAPPFQRHP